MGGGVSLKEEGIKGDARVEGESGDRRGCEGLGIRVGRVKRRGRRKRSWGRGRGKGNGGKLRRGCVDLGYCLKGGGWRCMGGRMGGTREGVGAPFRNKGNNLPKSFRE